MENQVDPQQLLVSLGMMIVLLIAWWEASKFVFKRLKSDFARIKDVRAREKAFRKKQKEVEEMKARGDMHEWISMPISGVGEEVMVCRKTGYVPSKEGFLPIEIIQHYEKSQAVEKKIKEEYDEFKSERVSGISERYEIPMEKMEDLMDEIYSIRKDFHVQKMEEELKRVQDTVRGLIDARSVEEDRKL